LIGDPFYIVSDIFQLGLFYANNKYKNYNCELIFFPNAKQNPLVLQAGFLFYSLSLQHKEIAEFIN